MDCTNTLKIFDMARTGKINYSVNRYCRRCRIIHELTDIRCRECNHKIAVKPRSKSGRVFENAYIGIGVKN